MTDPLADVVSLLRPAAPYAKLSSGAGAWRVSRNQATTPFYCAILEGGCYLHIEGEPDMRLEQDDFVLIPASINFSASSLQPVPAGLAESHTFLPDGEVRHGDPHGAPNVRMLVGYCHFASTDAALLLSLLPDLLLLHDQPRLTTLMQLLREESRQRRPARDIVLVRLTEVLLIEALRSGATQTSAPGLARGLADERIASALRQFHADPARAWTVPQLAGIAAMSRSAFFQRFSHCVGLPPMEYLLTWRMAVAKDLLRQGRSSIADIAERVGYSSASTFSVAFHRHAGQTPARYAKSPS